MCPAIVNRGGGQSVRIVVALLAIAIATLAPAAQALDIAWQIFDYPPMYIASGPLAGQGLMDRQLSLVIARLPGMRHKLSEVTFARAWYEIEHQDAACVLGTRKTPEREKIARFTQPISISGGLRLVTRAGHDLDLPVEDELVDLSRLAGRGDLRGGYAGRKSYGEEVGRFLQNPERRATMEVVPTEGQLFRLLQAGRIDFMFTYVSELDYYRLTGGDSAPLQAIRLRGDQDTVDSYIACSDSAAGREIVAQIDRQLEDRDFKASLQAIQENWASLTSPR